MAKKKSKKPQPEDAAVLLDAPVVVKTKKKSNFSVSPLVLVAAAVLAVGASVMGWFYVSQQQSIDELTETFTSMQQRVSNFQKVMDIPAAQTDGGDPSVEERISALEESQKEAQEKATVTLALSEEVKNSDLFPELLSLRAEMTVRWEEMKQAAKSVTALQDVLQNQSGELELLKERVAGGLSSSAALSDTVDRLSAACSQVVERVEQVDALNARLKGQDSDLHKLRDLLTIHSLALHAHNQEMAAIKDAVQAKQIMRAQAMEEMLSSVRTSLNEQFSTSQNLHSSVMAQLQTFQTQLETGPSWPIKHKTEDEDVASEEIDSTTAQSDAEQEEIQEEAEEEVEDVEEEEEDIDEDEVEEEIMQEEEALEQDTDADVTEEEEMTPEEETTTEEDVEEEITSEENTEEDITGEDEETDTTGEEEEEEAEEEMTEEELTEETIEDHTMEEEEEAAAYEEELEESSELVAEPPEDTEDDFTEEDEAEFL